MDLSGLPPSKQNAYWFREGVEGELSIVTMVSGPYVWYAPLFVYCIQKAYPHIGVHVYVRRPDATTMQEMAQAVPEGVMHWITPVLDEATNNCPPDGYTTAALRYIYHYAEAEHADFLLISDVDILTMREYPNIVDQHVCFMKRFGLECYDNYVSSYHEGLPRLPGVHFVTREWWKRTEAARRRYGALLASSGAPYYCWDEVMIAKLVEESGLPLNKARQNLGAIHGIHLGDLRIHMETPGWAPCFTAMQTDFCRQLCSDQTFMQMWTTCGHHLPQLQKMLDFLQNP